MILLLSLRSVSMLQMLCSTIQPVHNGIAIVYVVAYITSLVCACIQDLMHVTFNKLVMHSYHIMQDVLLICYSLLACKGFHVPYLSVLKPGSNTRRGSNIRRVAQQNKINKRLGPFKRRMPKLLNLINFKMVPNVKEN